MTADPTRPIQSPPGRGLCEAGPSGRGLRQASLAARAAGLENGAGVGEQAVDLVGHLGLAVVGQFD
jgi:hypothetical protein